MVRPAPLKLTVGFFGTGHRWYERHAGVLNGLSTRGRPPSAHVASTGFKDTDDLAQIAYTHCDVPYVPCRRQHIVVGLGAISAAFSGHVGCGFGHWKGTWEMGEASSVARRRSHDIYKPGSLMDGGQAPNCSGFVPLSPHATLVFHFHSLEAGGFFLLGETGSRTALSTTENTNIV